MKGTAHRASTAHPAITFIGRLALAALILVVLVEVYFLARGFNLYREAIEEAGLDEMAASIQSSESFTPIDELPDLYLQAVVAVEDHRSLKAAAPSPSSWRRTSTSPKSRPSSAR